MEVWPKRIPPPLSCSCEVSFMDRNIWAVAVELFVNAVVTAEPPWSWHPIKINNHQHYAIRLCCKNERLCWFCVWDIKHSFFNHIWRHSPPHLGQIAPNQRSSFVLGLYWFVPLKQTLYLFYFFRFIFGSCDVTLHPSSSKSHKTGVIRLCCWYKGQIYFPFLEITKTILVSDVILHPMPSKSLQAGAVGLCSICARFAVKTNISEPFLNIMGKNLLGTVT